MSHHRLSRATALAVLGIIFGVSFAAVAAPPPSEATWLWPLYESGTASSGLAVTSTPRPGVLTTMGEYEAIGASSTPSPHPGIDVLGDVQDIAVFPAAGSIVYVSNPGDYTAPGRYCRIWVTSSEVATQDFLYYVGHIRDETASPADGEDPEVRAAIDAAANAGVGNILGTSFEVDRGAVAGRLAAWAPDRPFHHVHLGVLDMADQFSCVDPLPFLQPSPRGASGEALEISDDESPTIASLELVPRDGSSAIVEDGFCGREVRGRFDVVLDATDTFYTSSPQPNPFPARDTIHPEVGIYGASYTVQRVDEPAGLTRQWYESPLGCLDTECGLWRLRYVGPRAAARLEDLFPVLKAEAPSFAGAAIVEALWDTSRSTEMDYSVDLTDPVHYYHYLSNGVKEDGTMDAEPGWDTTTLSDGRYVVTAKAWDRARNSVSTSQVVTVNNSGLTEAPGNSPGWASVYVADHPGDVGQVPSTMGGEPFYMSPDLIVEGAGSTVPCENKAPRGTAVVVGETYHVYLRVHNKGCLAVPNVSGVVFSAIPSAPLMDIRAVNTSGDYEGAVTVPAQGVACIGPFSWSPTEAELGNSVEGHRCLLGAIQSPVAAGPPVNDLESWDVSGQFNTAQRNLQIDLLTFIVHNDGDEAGAAELTIDMDGFPTDVPDVWFELLVEEAPGEDLVTLWNGAAANVVVTRETIESVTYAVVRILGERPVLAWSLPGVSERRVQARYAPRAGSATYHVDVNFTLNGVDEGGTIFQIQEVEVR